MRERQSNIELLRILSIMGVIVLHYNNSLYGGGLALVEPGSLNFYLLYTLESLFVCAVNLFLLISGYFMVGSSKRNIWKPIELIVQVSIFAAFVYFARVVIGNGSFSPGELLRSFIPCNYFVILYIAVYFISPFINIIFECNNSKVLNLFTGTVFLVFSVYPTAVDILIEVTKLPWYGLSTIGAYGSQWGYSFVNFCMMYVIGAYIRKMDVADNPMVTGRRLFVSFLSCIVIIVVWARINDHIGFASERTAWEYCNPVVIAEAVILFLLFLKIDMGCKKGINVMAKGALSVYLLHAPILPYIKVAYFVNRNPLVLFLHIVISAVGIYFICSIVYFVYNAITAPVLKKLSRLFNLHVIDAGI